MEETELQQRIADLQADWIEMGIRRLGGDLHTVFAVMHGTGAIGSLTCSIDGYDLLEADRVQIMEHSQKSTKRNGK